jgi:hypothetical protein
VSTLSKVFSEAFTKPGYAMEDFLDHTYATVGILHAPFLFGFSVLGMILMHNSSHSSSIPR